ncbi:MAG: hypothetical protein PHV17_02435 [Candidatus Omnitrophica bacterium]|nr:hypothetical protein [Candidatus Omnitrophota bacterium]
MVNSLEIIRENLKRFDKLSPYSLKSFWSMPDLGDDPYWGRGIDEPSSSVSALFISGPSRNGNHLIHSMMDNHPQLPRVPGEDSFLGDIFRDLHKDPFRVKQRLESKGNVEYILNCNGCGHDKWRLLSEISRQTSSGKAAIWSGTQQPGKGYALDYQDTIVKLDYSAYRSRLEEQAQAIRQAATFMDVLWIYLEALTYLDPLRRENKISYMLVGSGMRAETNFVISRTNRLKCLVPIRPFESYYHSFVKGQLRSSGIRPEYIQEAWEHWWHKVVDYLILKQKYPDSICLINFNHVLEYLAPTAKEICRFLDIEYDNSCLVATSMGHQVKGNSSFPKDEEHRGLFYKTGMKKILPKEYWPQLYPKLWDMVSKLAI